MWSGANRLRLLGAELHRQGREPVVDLALFRHRPFSCGSSMITLYFAAFTPLFFIHPLPAARPGVPGAAGRAVHGSVRARSAATGGRIVGRYGRSLVTGELAVVAPGLAGSILAVHLVPRHGTGGATVLPLLVAGLDSELVIAPNQALSLDSATRRGAHRGQRCRCHAVADIVEVMVIIEVAGGKRADRDDAPPGRAGAGQRGGDQPPAQPAPGEARPDLGVVEDPLAALVEVGGVPGQLTSDPDLVTMPLWHVRHARLRRLRAAGLVAIHDPSMPRTSAAAPLRCAPEPARAEEN